MFKEVIVVEGRDDTRRLKEIYPNIETFETGGSAISPEILDQIKKLNDLRGVIVFTDPDFPGGQIRQKIINHIGHCKQAFLERSDAIPKKGKGLGVEHGSDDAIKKALERVMTPSVNQPDKWNQAFLVSLKLIGHPTSKARRELLANLLGIGYVNGKQLLNRLKMFGISKDEIIHALEGFEN